MIELSDDLKKTMDSLPYYAMLVDEKHNIVFPNKALVDVLKTPPEKIIGSYCPKIVHGMDSPFPGCPLEEAVSAGKVEEKEYFDQHSKRWMLSVVYPTELKTDDGSKVYFHTARDITGQKQTARDLARTSKRFENITQGIREGIMLLGEDLTIAWANNELLKQTGLKLEEIVGQHCYKVTHKRDAPCQPPDDICPIVAIQKTNAPTTVVHKHFDKDGRPYYVEIHVYPIKDEFGSIQYVHMSRDITERKLAEMKIDEQMTDLEEFRKVSIGRELKMIELEKEIERLKADHRP